MRYYPSRLLPDGAEKFYKHAKDYSDFIVNKISKEGGARPKIIKKGLDRIIVEAGHASGRFTVEVGINPFITCLEC